MDKKGYISLIIALSVVCGVLIVIIIILDCYRRRLRNKRKAKQDEEWYYFPSTPPAHIREQIQGINIEFWFLNSNFLDHFKEARGKSQNKIDLRL